MSTTTMKELYKEERPYEKCVKYGAGALSDGELLAVVMRTGTLGENACQLAGRILSLPGYEGLKGLNRIALERLMEVRGVGQVKTVQLKCVAELAARMARAEAAQRLAFDTPETIADYFMEDLRYAEQEQLHVLFLNTRNKLLKELVFHPEYEATLDVWDEQLVRFGKEVIKARRNFINQLGGIIKELHTKLSGGKENIEVIYDPDTEEEELEAAVRKSRQQDMKQKTTLAGPHRDDISFVVNGIDIRRFGSQGQQRTAALSLKLSELELVKKISRDDPVLLLDDVLSELDSSRQNQLLDAIQDIQTMITCTGLEDFVNHRFHIDKIFKVEEGKVTSQN